MWSSDFELNPGEWFGEWLHAQIAEQVHVEHTGFMTDRVRAASARLQAERPADQRYVTEVPWLEMFSAFTAPGRYVYFSRRLLEMCPHEDAVAFVIAHEIAHHDLGHLELFSGRFARRAATLSAGFLMIFFFRVLQKRIYSPEWELEADRRAMDLCLKASYDPARCLYLFSVLQKFALDFGDLAGVYGPDPQSDQELSAEATLMTKARIWLYQRRRGYLPLQDRQMELVRHITQRTGATAVKPRGD
jgi:predicted Zn-dependent protease